VDDRRSERGPSIKTFARPADLRAEVQIREVELTREDREALDRQPSADLVWRDRRLGDSDGQVELPVPARDVAVLEEEKLDLPEARRVDSEGVGLGPVLAVGQGELNVD